MSIFLIGQRWKWLQERICLEMMLQFQFHRPQSGATLLLQYPEHERMSQFSYQHPINKKHQISISEWFPNSLKPFLKKSSLGICSLVRATCVNGIMCTQQFCNALSLCHMMGFPLRSGFGVFTWPPNALTYPGFCLFLGTHSTLMDIRLESFYNCMSVIDFLKDVHEQKYLFWVCWSSLSSGKGLLENILP